MTENEYLEIHWSIEDTIENLKTIKEHFIATVLKANLDGKGKQDAKEVEFDFNRAIQALERQIPKKVYHFTDDDTFETSCCGTDVTNEDYKYCPECGQLLGEVEEVGEHDRE